MSQVKSGVAAPEVEPDEGETIESRELGAIQIGRRVGRGGMGRVHEAWRPNLPDATFAVKFLEPSLLANPEALERFESEARRLSELRHRNIVRVLGYGRTKWGPCILMELLKGRPLSKLLESQGGALDRGLACSVIVEVLEGLQRVHEKGLVHRDIKGDNIFLETGDGDVVVKLIDFGIVQDTVAGKANASFVGTPTAAAPEQLLGQPIGGWTDMYQVGVLAYELLSGRHPFHSVIHVSFEAIAHAQILEVPPSLATLVPDLPADVVEAVMTMLQKDPAHRVRPGREGRPDGSPRAFRTPFRNLLRELEQAQQASAGTQTTQHRMLQMVQASAGLPGPGSAPTPSHPGGQPGAPDRTMPLVVTPPPRTLPLDGVFREAPPSFNPNVTPPPSPALGPGSAALPYGGRHTSTTSPTASAGLGATSPSSRSPVGAIVLVGVLAALVLGAVWTALKPHGTHRPAAASSAAVPSIAVASASAPSTPDPAPAASVASAVSASAASAASAPAVASNVAVPSAAPVASTPVVAPGRGKPGTGRPAPAGSARDPGVWGLGVFQ